MVRPDGLLLSKEGDYTGKIQWLEYLGSITRINMLWNDESLIIDVPSGDLGDSIPVEGQELNFKINMANAVKMNK